MLEGARYLEELRLSSSLNLLRQATTKASHPIVYNFDPNKYLTEEDYFATPGRSACHLLLQRQARRLLLGRTKACPKVPP